MSELKQIIEAYGLSAADAAVLSSEDTAHLVADGHRILSSRTVGGLEVVAQETAQGISATVTVKEGVRIENPVHLCFGVMHRRGSQKIEMRVKLERRSSAHFIAHCMFPNAERVKHIMDGIVELAEGAELRYSETHFHGPHGGVTVLPKAVVRVGEGARYFGDFTLTSGRVGRLDIDYRVDTAKDGVTELVARVFGHGDDRIVIREEVTLSGDNARSLIKTRVAIEDEATAEVTGITSSRKIAQCCRENIMFMALSADTQPHFTTIADFISTLHEEIIRLFLEVLLICDEMGLIGKEMFAIDGCKLPCNASKEWSGTKEDLQRKKDKMQRVIRQILTRHREMDVTEASKEIAEREQQYVDTLKKKVKEIKEWLEGNDDKVGKSGTPLKSNITDNESAKMKTSHGVIQGYDGIAVVDDKHQVIVHAEAFGAAQEHDLLFADA